MNDREIGEIRRRTRRDRSNMASIYGCYVNSQKEIISEFKKSTVMMSENEADKFFTLLKRTLSGTNGKNLLDICFKTSQVGNSSEHKLLMDLRSTELKDDALRHALYEKIIQSVKLSDSFLILLGCDHYDVPFKSKDEDEQTDASCETYTYLQCAICPVKLAKANLRYDGESKQFLDGSADNVVSAPEMGFLFPAFDNRSSNIYNALFYTRSPKEGHQNLIETLFCVEPPKPAAEQKKSFEALLTTSIADQCSLDVVQSVHDQLRQCIDMHKESKIPEPLLISKEQVKMALNTCGVSESHIAKFSVEYDEVFGFEAQLHPKNIINNKQFVINTPDVTVKVNPERSDLVETRIIDGVKYLMICVDDNVEVNGVNIHIAEK